ncbi:hypothetical protein [Salinispira pacifica]
MEILVNDEPITFTLEGEKNLGEVVSQLESWLTESRLTLSGLRVDGNDLPLYAPERWKSHPIDGVSKVQVTASTYREMKLSTMQTLLQYIMLLHSGVEAHRDAELKELLAEYPYIRTSLANLIGRAPSSDERSAEPEEPGSALVLDELLQTSGLLEGSITDESQREPILTHLKKLQLLLIDRMKEITQPDQEVRTTAELLRSSIPEISDVSVMLQTGKDREAMAAVITFTEILGKLIRIVPYLKEADSPLLGRSVEGRSLGDVAGELNGFLNELVEAFAAQDSVLIGDLLEYEIAPRVQQVVTLFSEDAPPAER